MLLDDEDAATRDAKARHRGRPFAARDRFTVDKNAPERRRAIRWDLLDDEEQDETDDGGRSLQLDPIAVADTMAAGEEDDAPRGHLFSPATDGPGPGDPALYDPAEAMAVLGTPLAYAQHALLLSESFRQTCGAARTEAIAYLAELFLALPDGDFARSALRELGLGTGIVDIYPLEAIVHILESAPHFLPRTEFGLVVQRPTLDRGALRMEPFRARVLSVLPDRVIRGFALAGGPRPGYRFEPAPEIDQYRLVLGAPGRFEILVSARAPTGTIVDRLWVHVAGEAPEALPPDDPIPDLARLAHWPRPKPRPPSPAPSGPHKESPHLSLGERWSRATQDALRGPKGEETFYSTSVDQGAQLEVKDRIQGSEANARTQADSPTAPSECPKPAPPQDMGASVDATDVDIPVVHDDREDTRERFEASARSPAEVTEPDVRALEPKRDLRSRAAEPRFEPAVAPPPRFYRPPSESLPSRRSTPLVGNDETDDLPG